MKKSVSHNKRFPTQSENAMSKNHQEKKIKVVCFTYGSIDQILKKPSNHSFYVKDIFLSKEFEVKLFNYNSIRKSNKIKTTYFTIKTIKKYNPDIIYLPSFSGNNEFALLKFLGFLHCKIVGWKYTEFWNSRSRIFDYIFAHILWSQVDRIYMMSETHRTDAINRKIIASDRIFTLNWGVDYHWYTQFRMIPQELDFTVIASGKDSRDYDTLCSACEKAKVKLEVFTRRHKSCVEAATKFQNSRYCKITFIEDLNISNEYEYIMKQCARASVFAICCEKRAYGVGYTNLVDTLSFEVPIMMTNNKDVPINTEEYGIGYMIDPYDVDTWAEKLIYLKSHPEVCFDMSSKIKQLINKDFSSQKTFAKIRQDFLKLAN